MPSGKLARDLLVYFAFSALPIAGFLLAGTADTQFYVSLLTISLLGIFGILLAKALHMRWAEEIDKFLVYSEELEGFSFVLIMLGVVGCLFISSFLISNFVGQNLTSIIVPTPKMALQVGAIALPPFWSDVLFTLTLVAPAEECSKLVTTLGFYVWLKDVLGKSAAGVIAIVVPIATWAALHMYVSYHGQYMLVYAGSAFISGLLIFYVMKKTKSLLAAVLVHSLYNISILFLTMPH